MMSLKLRLIFSFTLLTLLPAASLKAKPVLDRAGAPSEVISREIGHCVVIAPQKNRGVLSQLSRVCTEEAPRIFRELGVNFNNNNVQPVNIRVVNHPSEMHQLAPAGASLPLWSGAVAFPAHNLVMLPLQRLDGGPADNLETTLEHELSHVAFHAASGAVRTPRWFSEGIAILQSEGSAFHRKQSIWWASMIDDIRPLSEIEKYPEGAKSAEQAYAQSADFTSFLIEREGWGAIRELLSSIGTGESFDDAFQDSFGASVSYLEKKWHKHLFGGMGWLLHVTGDGLWLGFGALICVVGFFLVRRRKKRRLKEMEDEERHLEDAIASLDALIAEHPNVAMPRTPSPTAMERAKQLRVKIEVDGDFHTLH